MKMDPAEREKQVLDIAAEVFAEKGYRAANVTDIVTRAGIGRGTFYLYFKSKQDVFLAVIEKYFGDLVEILGENKARLDETIRGGGRALATLRENMLRILQYHRDNPEVTSVIYREAMGNDEHFSSRVRELTDIANHQLLEEFRVMQDAGMLRDYDLDLVITVIMGSVFNLIMERIVGCTEVELEALVDQLISYHARALVREDSELAFILDLTSSAMEKSKP